MKVGILGGAFDPIHKSHIETAKAVLRTRFVDHVFITPCYNHKFGKQMASAEHRMEMIRRAINETCEDYNVALCPVEINMKHEGSTYEFLKHMKKTTTNMEFFCIAGLDNAATIQKWHRWEELIEEFPFIVVNRYGSKDEPHAWYHRDHHFYLDVADKTGTMSSTKAREWLRDGKMPEELPASVMNYITFNKLYKT